MLVSPARRGKNTTSVALPPTPPETPFRGYWVGMGPRSVSRITANSSARSTVLVEEMTWASAQSSQAMNDAYQLTTAAKARLDAFSDLLDSSANNFNRGKLRMLTGMDSPLWAKQLAGGPLNWQDTDGNGAVQIPVWFNIPIFLGAYEKYVIAVRMYLATKSTRIVEVTIAGASTVYTELAVKQIGGGFATENGNTAKAAGYTPAGDIAAAKRCIDIHHAQFSPLGITSSLALNPWQEFTRLDTTTPGGKATLQPTYDLWQYQRSVMGRMGVWQNNSIGAYFTTPGVVEARGGDYRDLYEYMSLWAKTHGQPIGFQSMTMPKMYGPYNPTRPDPTALYVAQLGGLGVEGAAAGGGYPGWDDNTHITITRAATLNGLLAANASALA